MPGVLHIHIHAHDGQTIIDYNPALTSFDDIAQRLESAGYHVQ